ncbi:Na/Pi cotransporter family protein [Natrinema salaciae]|uniref:Solute carrier family 34 (Sodium-dependent phosphate cotransporter) n=1 Tax=Natrinema salaciae TaxID=1186196 RepID=A0A1H9EED8_9EURY|nr:sodium:phosphate symporter [Natrinema salaciae]SEQ24090.1 solute carrier family 34 (sodium-dependent phosphate cotransporter) [Natrinema salaciae]
MEDISRETSTGWLRDDSSLVVAVQVVATVVLFLFAIRLLGSATDALTPSLRGILSRIIVDDGSALGLSWIASYVLANGSIVAALSLSLFNSGLVLPSQLFLMIVGSRLGGGAVVVFIGAFDYLNEEVESLRESMSLGLLTFLLTHSIYLPAMVLGYAAMPAIRTEKRRSQALSDLEVSLPDVLSIVTDGLIDVVGGGVAFLLAIGCILLSLQLFDRILDGIDKQRLRRRYVSRLQDKWVSFGLGLVVTGVTTSVAFSLGVIVPLYNRGHIKRSEIMPFVLGANIGTLIDTLVVAVALNTFVGIRIVLVLVAIGSGMSVVVLAFYAPYGRLIDRAQNRIIDNTGYFVGVLLSLLLVPLLLIVFP